MKAYRVTAIGITLIVASTSRPKATIHVISGLRDAHYRVTFKGVRSTRSPQHDEWAGRQDKDRAATEVDIRMGMA